MGVPDKCTQWLTDSLGYEMQLQCNAMKLSLFDFDSFERIMAHWYEPIGRWERTDQTINYTNDQHEIMDSAWRLWLSFASNNSLHCGYCILS